MHGFLTQSVSISFHNKIHFLALLYLFEVFNITYIFYMQMKQFVVQRIIFLLNSFVSKIITPIYKLQL